MKFEKGKSGNPGGRPKEDPEVKILARQHSKDAVERLVYWMHSENAKASVSAAQAILDRAWGKPSQSVDLGTKDGQPLITEVVWKFVEPTGRSG
jgi:hypothetical protein